MSGRNGEVLDALQELTRLAVQQSTGERSKLDARHCRLACGTRDELTGSAPRPPRASCGDGDREQLEPMTPFERKIVHDAVATVAGVTSESEGAEPNRRVVIVKE